MLWVDKYKPAATAEILGHQHCILKIKGWLHSWYQYINNSSTQHRHMPYKCILLHGPPGCGKTTSAILCTTEQSFVPLEFNASDSRSKKMIKELVNTDNYFINQDASSTLEPKLSKNYVVIMDEIDGMSTGDGGGMAEIDRIIEASHFPLILISNDITSLKFQKLKTKCEVIRFTKVDISHMIKKGEEILRAEHPPVSPDSDMYEQILHIPKTEVIKWLEMSGNVGDIRNFINQLQFFSGEFCGTWRDNGHNFTQLGLFQTVTDFFDAEKLKQNAKKNEDKQKYFECKLKTNSLVDDFSDMSHKISVCFNELSMIPLCVQENYLELSYPDSVAQKKSLDEENLEWLERIADSAESISCSETMNSSGDNSPGFDVLQEYLVCGTIYPSWNLRGEIINFARFPRFFGALSTQSKHTNILRSLIFKKLYITTQIMSSGDLTCDFLPFLVEHILLQLSEKRFEEIQATMLYYGIDKSELDDLFAVAELNFGASSTKRQPTRSYFDTELDTPPTSVGDSSVQQSRISLLRKSISPQTKSAFTRSCKSLKDTATKKTVKKPAKRSQPIRKPASTARSTALKLAPVPAPTPILNLTPAPPPDSDAVLLPPEIDISPTELNVLADPLDNSVPLAAPATACKSVPGKAVSAKTTRGRATGRGRGRAKTTQKNTLHNYFSPN